MGAPTGAIRSGRAFVEMFANTDKLYAALDGAKRRVLAFGQTMGKVGLTAAAAGGAALAPLTRIFGQAVEEGANIGVLAKRWGMTAESVSTLQGAFAQAGVSGEQFGNTMDDLSSKINEAAYANEKLWNSASAPTGAELWGRDKTEQLYEFADAFSKLSDASEQTDVAKRFGLLPLIEQLRKGRQGIIEFQEAAIANGDAMSGADVKAATEIHREFNRVNLSVRSTLLEVGKALLPTGESYASFGAQIRGALGTAREWIKTHREVIAAAAAVAAGFVLAGLSISTIGFAAVAVIPALTALKISLGMVNALMAPLIGAFGGAAVAGAALAAVFVLVWSQTDHGKAKLAELKTAFGEFFEWMKGSGQGIKDALSVGDWTLAFEIGIATADAAWKGFVFGLQAAWTEFKSLFVDGWKDMVTGLQVAFIDLTSFIVSNMADALKKLVDNYNAMLGSSRLAKQFKIDSRGMKSGEDTKAEFDADKNKILEKRAKEQADADKSRGKVLGDAEKKFVDALLHLEELKRRAAEEAAKGIAEEFKVLSDAGLASILGGVQGAGRSNFPVISDGVKGTYGGSIQQALGYGDNVGDRQLAETKRIGDTVQEGNRLLQVLIDKPGGIILK